MPTTLKAILHAVKIWLLLAVVFLVSVFVFRLNGPWNYYWLFTMGCWLVLDVYWGLAARTMKPAVPIRQNHLALWGSIVIYALYCLPLSSVPLLGQRVFPPLFTLEILGALMCAFGVVFAIWARHVLAESWNAHVTLKDGQALVQHGPYAIVRHPIYFGFLVAVIGMVLVLREVRAFALLIGIEILLKKMGREECILRARFPGDYPQYEQRVRRLLPWVW